MVKPVMNHFFSAIVTLVGLLCLAALFCQPVVASEDKPFAEAHIVLQLGDGDAEIQGRTLSVANNLIKHYGGPEMVDLEIVAYGPGISLLYPDSEQNERVISLLASEVRFVACMNTVATIERQTGKRPQLIEAAIPVKTGVAHLVQRVGEGFVVIRP